MWGSEALFQPYLEPAFSTLFLLLSPPTHTHTHTHAHAHAHAHAHTHISLLPLTQQHSGEKPRKDFKEGRELISPSLGQNYNLQANKSFPNVNWKANVVYFLTAFYLFECCIFLLVNFPLIKPLIHQWYFLIYNRLTELMLLTLGLFSFSFFFLFFFFSLVCFPGHADLFGLDCFTFVFNVSLNVIVKACML